VDVLALSLAGLCLTGEEFTGAVSLIKCVEPRDKVIADISTIGGDWAAGNGGIRRCCCDAGAEIWYSSGGDEDLDREPKSGL